MATASKRTTTSTAIEILTPSAVRNMLGEARQNHDNLVAQLPEKIRHGYMREAGFAEELILRGPGAEYLRKCNPLSLRAAFLNTASLGLTLNPLKKHCTIIARWNKAINEFEANNLIMYQGLMFLATQAGVKDITAEVVYSADKFTMKRTHEGDHFDHEINIVTPRGAAGNEFRGVYVAAKMPGSTYPKVEWIPAEDIYKMRAQSDNYLDDKGKEKPNAPWVKWFDEQAKKGALKRASKRWEELVEANDAWNVFKKAVETDNRQDNRQPIDGEATEVVDPKDLVTVDQITVIKDAMKEAEMPDRLIMDAYEVDAFAKLRVDKFEEILQRIQAFGKAKKEKLAKTAKAAGSKK